MGKKDSISDEQKHEMVPQLLPNRHHSYPLLSYDFITTLLTNLL